MKNFYYYVLIISILICIAINNTSFAEDYTKFKKAVPNKTVQTSLIPKTTSSDCVKVTSLGGIYTKNNDLSMQSPEYINCLNDLKAYDKELAQTLQKNTSCIPGGTYSVVIKPEDVTAKTVLKNYHISRSSGNNIADGNALNAMRKTLPYKKPFPASCSIIDYRFELTFMYNCAYSDTRQCDPHWHTKH